MLWSSPRRPTTSPRPAGRRCGRTASAPSWTCATTTNATRSAGRQGSPPCRFPLDGFTGAEFWAEYGHLDGTPLYFSPYLAYHPKGASAAVAAIARAEPGGVLVHCAVGRDRTGLVSLLLLALVDVEPEEIATDYALSTERVRGLLARIGQERQEEFIAATLSRERTTHRRATTELLASLDLESCLRAAGLTGDDLAALRARLVA